MLFKNDIKEKILCLLKDEISNYITEIKEISGNIPEYNPDEEQSIFKIAKSKLPVFQYFYPYVTEEKRPSTLSKDDLDEKSQIKAWIVKIEYEEDGETKRVLFFQKFIKSQFMQAKKMFFVLENDEFKLLKNNILGMGNLFDVVCIDNIFISKNLKTFEYVFDFAEHYRNKSKEFIKTLESSELIEVKGKGKAKIEEKIERSKRFAYKMYTAQQNKYYEQIDIKNLIELKKQTSIKVKIQEDKIIVDEDTNLDDLVKVLNDDFEQSLLTDNKYISQKKKKLKN